MLQLRNFLFSVIGSSKQCPQLGVTLDSRSSFFETLLIGAARYLQYIEMCSRVVRHSLKEPHRALAIKRGEQGLKFAKWNEGKQGVVGNIVIPINYIA